MKNDLAHWREFLCPPTTNFLRVMKLTVFLMFVGLMSVHAGGYSQHSRVSLSLEDAYLSDFFKTIEKKSPYRFAFSNDVVNAEKKVSVDVKRISVAHLLDRILSGTHLKYRFDEKTGFFIISELTDSDSVTQHQDKVVHGRVINEKGEPLAGVTVQIKGKSTFATTQADGSFTITVGETDRTLLFSYVDMESQELTIEGTQPILVTMLSNDKSLTDVVVVGYGSRSRSNVLQGISSLKAEKVGEIPAANITQTLAGRMPGLFITQTGGKPGRSSNVRVRAYDGFGSSRPPLFVIDGVIADQFAFDGLDASEVENISVLKDGASSSIYGARAANGVILVTTKRGTTGKPKINYVGSYGIEEATKVPATLNAYDEAIFTNDYLKQTDPNYQNNAAFYADDELEYFKNNSWNLIDQYFIRPTVMRHSLNLSGGTDRVNYYLGGSYFRGTGSFDNLEFQKYNLRAKVEAKVTKDLTVSLNLNTDVRNDEKPYWRWDSDNDDFLDLYRNTLLRGKMSPDYITVDGQSYPVGNLMKWHPGEVINGNSGYNRKKWTNYQAQIDVTYSVPFVKGLQLRSTYAKYSRHDSRKELNLPYKLYTFNTEGSRNHIVGDELDPTRTFERNDGNWVAQSYASSDFYQLNFYVNYERNFGRHGVSAMAAYEQYESNNHNFKATNWNVISPSLDQLSLASSDTKDFRVLGGQLEDGRLSYIGRVAYNFDGQYFLESSFRYEGSRYFTPENRYGFFPSVSAGWRISKANFFRENVSFVNDLKLRASFGITGDDQVGPNIDNFTGQLQWAQSYRKTNGAVFGGAATNGITPGTIPNPTITWAKKRTFNYGVDATFWQNQLSLTLDIFNNRRTDILGPTVQSIPSTFGGVLPSVNYGIITSRGIEMDLSYRKVITDDLSLFASANFGYATNKQVLIDEASNIRPYQSQLGRPTGGVFGLIATDIIRTQADLDRLPADYTINGAVPRLGMLNFRDIRGATSDTPDGKIDENDREFIADYSSAPLTYGFSVGARWRAFSIDLLFQGLSGHKKLRAITWHSAQWLTQESASFSFWKDHWTPENTNASYPLYSDYGGTGSASTFWLDDASFLRLKNVNIGYDLPSRIAQRIHFENIKIFFNGVNMLLLKDNIKLYDPEGGINAYPISRSYTLGLNITL